VWTDTSGHEIPEYKKMELGSLLDVYDRVLFVDTDVIIRGDAPDIFQVVPADSLGVFEEGRYHERTNRTIRFMEHIGFDSMEWDGKYYNSGVIVFSKAHRNLFVTPKVEWDQLREQTYFNTLIADRRPTIYSLPPQFDWVLTMDSILGESRLDAYFIHYAGLRGWMDDENALRLIEQDLKAWSERTSHHKPLDNIALAVEGGLGAQVAAEPVLRYARDVLYQGDNLIVVTSTPKLFAHLDIATCENLQQVPGNRKYHSRHTSGSEGTQPAAWPSRHQVHPTQWAALMALGVELPTAYRRAMLSVDAAALARVTQRAAGRNLRDLVLLHPGRGAPANTFPAEVWQAYAAALAAGGFHVAVIGRRVDERHGVVEFDRSQYLDLVDQLSIEELVALVSQARALVSNDSGPIQIAGAFDNWIGLIATLRHPDYVLPWRHGSQSWRAYSLERQPLYRDYLHKPSGTRQPSLEACDPDRLRACLPTPDRVVQFAKLAFEQPSG
jgi:hypothetical protein